MSISPAPLAGSSSPGRLRRALPRLISLTVGTVLGIVLIVLLLRGVNGHVLVRTLSRANYWLLAAAVTPSVAILFLKVERWRVLLGADSPGRNVLFAALNVGYAVNTLLPARIGDLVSAYWLARQGTISLVRTISTIAVERVADGLTLCVILFVLAPSVALPPRILMTAVVAGVLGALILGGLILVAALMRTGRRAWWIFGRYRETRVGGVLQQVTAGVRALHSGSSAASFVVWTCLIWAATVVQVWLALAAFDIQLPPAGVVLLTAVLFLSMAVPAAPAYIGVFDYVMVLMLGLYGVARTPAVAAALACHAVVFLPVTVIGMVYLARAGSQTAAQIFETAAGG
ncbi:MAG TPA: lysylphosphatidylglycerol synthase transmembrane domain-containing protein [Chloroflexota bacterium]|nr:lysylphosphatidylglycerol synthase transmembrane domain-containing protein [Chloroflexota bacterium]